jgi:putative transcriptional regulator
LIDARIKFTLQYDEMAVKNNIRKFRKIANLTQADLADAAGISRQAYVNIELGKSVPSTWTALKLASLLQTPVEELFWLDDASS